VEQAVGMMVDSNTLVSKNVVIQDEILTNSQGYIRNYEVLNKNQTGVGLWQVQVRADVDTTPDAALMNDLTRLGIINKQLRNPKIAVVINEKHHWGAIPDPAAETAVIRKLTQAGFSRVTEVSEERLKYAGLTGFNAASLTAEDLRNLAQSMTVDYVVTGEAFSDSVGDVGKYIGKGKRLNVISCRARVEARVYNAATGQILTADAATASAVDNSEWVAAKEALNKAGEKLADNIIAGILNAGSNMNKEMEVVLLVPGYSYINEVKSALQELHGVNQVIVDDYSNGRAVLSVQYGGAPDTLYQHLKSASRYNIDMVTQGYNTLTVRVY